MIVCDACGEEVRVMSIGDESVDYCEQCERIVEGNTLYARTIEERDADTAGDVEI